MHRRTFLAVAPLAAAALAVRRDLAAAQAPAAPPAPAAQSPLATKFEEVRRGVGIFTGNGGTIGYLVNGAGAAAVDSQFLNAGEACVAGLKARTPKGVHLLLNTHHHFDHTQGNLAFRPVVRRIVAHAACVEWHKKVAAQENTTAKEAFADTTFTTTWREAFGDETIEARHYGAGHTSGDAVVTFQKANVMHMGDLLAIKAHPNIDRPAGGSVVSWIAVLEQVAKAASADTIFIAGHAKDGAVLAKRADVLNFRDYFTAAMEHVRAGIKAGQSREQIVAATGLKGFEDYIVRVPRFPLSFVLGICHDEAR